MGGRRSDFETWFTRTIWHGMWGYAPGIPLDTAVLETYWRCYDAGANAEMPHLIEDVEQWLTAQQNGRRRDGAHIAWGSYG